MSPPRTIQLQLEVVNLNKLNSFEIIKMAYILRPSVETGGPLEPAHRFASKRPPARSLTESGEVNQHRVGDIQAAVMSWRRTNMCTLASLTFARAALAFTPQCIALRNPLSSTAMFHSQCKPFNFVVPFSRRSIRTNMNILSHSIRTEKPQVEVTTTHTGLSFWIAFENFF